jgi:hypothetical protein
MRPVRALTIGWKNAAKSAAKVTRLTMFTVLIDLQKARAW